jgi:flagellar hook-length control protein FliK
VENPAIPAASTTPAETPATPNHLRGPQIPNSFANRLEAASAERKSNDPLNGVDRTRFVQRVARAFQRVGETEGEIRLRLSPPELGAVKLEVSLRDGAMIARMETETTAARNLLMENLPQLKERLAEQNVRIETFEVEVRDQSNQSSADDAREQLRQQTEQQRNRLRGERATTPVVAQPIVRTLPAARQSSQLNVVI